MGTIGNFGLYLLGMLETERQEARPSAAAGLHPSVVGERCPAPGPAASAGEEPVHAKGSRPKEALDHA
eukprot:8891905-Alexandrium_andersonii.AAC.1